MLEPASSVLCFSRSSERRCAAHQRCCVSHKMYEHRARFSTKEPAIDFSVELGRGFEQRMSCATFASCPPPRRHFLRRRHCPIMPEPRARPAIVGRRRTTMSGRPTMASVPSTMRRRPGMRPDHTVTVYRPAMVHRLSTVLRQLMRRRTLIGRPSTARPLRMALRRPVMDIHRPMLMARRPSMARVPNMARHHPAMDVHRRTPLSGHPCAVRSATTRLPALMSRRRPRFRARSRARTAGARSRADYGGMERDKHSPNSALSFPAKAGNPVLWAYEVTGFPAFAGDDTAVIPIERKPL
jgi:hypothetical protein